MELEHLLKLFVIVCIVEVVILILLAIIVPNLFSHINNKLSDKQRGVFATVLLIIIAFLIGYLIYTN